MSIFVDSANIAEVQRALETGYVMGVTTNPLLMEQNGKPWRKTLKELCEISPGHVYYQFDQAKTENMIDAAVSIFRISPEQIILKLPATQPFFKLASEIGHEIPCCMTAVYSEAQMIAAYECGATFIAVYVNRITKHYGSGKDKLSKDGPAMISSMREIIDSQTMNIQILAASIKSPEEAVEAFKAGAHHVTTTIGVIDAMAEHPLSAKANEDFTAACEKKPA